MSAEELHFSALRSCRCFFLWSLFHIFILCLLDFSRCFTCILPPPPLRLVDLLYNFLSANRLSLGGALDGIIAAKRMDLSKQGKETCGGEWGGEGAAFRAGQAGTGGVLCDL